MEGAFSIAVWVLRSALAFGEDSISFMQRDHGRTPCVVTEGFSGPPKTERPLTPVEAQTTLYFVNRTKLHSAVVLTFDGYKINEANSF